jgi:hypothetical protein
MNKRKISAKELVSDIKSGMTDAQLMAKHELTPKGLEGLFSKLIQAGLLSAKSLGERVVVKADAKPGMHEDHAAPAPAVSSKKNPTVVLKAVAEGVKGGLHDSELMRRHELSPGKLKEIKNELVQLGYLAPEHVQPAEIKKTKLCPFCSKEIQQYASKCVHCGQWLTAPESGGPAGAYQAGAGISRPQYQEPLHDEDERECPWEERESYGTLNAYFATATKSLLHPTEFFSRLPIDAGYLNPILFGVMTVVLSAVFTYIWSALLRGGGGLFVFLIGIPFVVLGSFIMVPIVLFIGSGILHLCLLLVRGANEGYQATFRVVSYSSVPSLFSVVPIVGSIASLWSIVLMVIGLREMHKTSTGKSVIAVLLPVAFLVAVGIVASLTVPAMLREAAYAPRTSSVVSGLSTGQSSQNSAEDVCSALEEYVSKIDELREQDGAGTAAQVQSAMRELDEALNQFENDRRVARIRKAAHAFGLGMIARIQVKKVMKGSADWEKIGQALDTQRDVLLRMCVK